MLYFADLEADSLTPTKIHVLVIKAEGRIIKVKSKEEFHKLPKPTGWVFHNGLGYDVPVLNRLWDAKIDPTKVIDTMVVSKLINYNKYNTHSLEEIGKAIGVYKSSFEGDWSVWSQEMEDYCVQDVEVCEAIFNAYKKDIYDPAWKKALRLEHDTAWLCHKMTENGFRFDIPKAEKLLDEVTKDMDTLEASFRAEIGRVLKENKRLKVRHKKDGSLYENILTAIAEADKVELDADTNEYVIFKYEDFNPGSPKQRIDVLWEYGWKPHEMTKGHKDFLRKERE